MIYIILIPYINTIKNIISAYIKYVHPRPNHRECVACENQP